MGCYEVIATELQCSRIASNRLLLEPCSSYYFVIVSP